MRAGQLNKFIEIQTFTTIDDAYGKPIKTWVKHSDQWAAIWPQKSQEVVIDGKLVVVDRSLIRIRYTAGITGAMRVKFGERIFEIKGIKNIDEKNVTLDLLCNENR